MILDMYIYMYVNIQYTYMQQPKIGVQMIWCQLLSYKVTNTEPIWPCPNSYFFGHILSAIRDSQHQPLLCVS